MAGIVTQKDNVRLFIWEDEKQVSASDKMGNITEVGDIGGDTEDVDVTTIESSAKEYVSGYTDNGIIDTTLHITSNVYAKMDAIKNDGTDIRWGVSVFTKKGVQILGLQGKGQLKSVELTGISLDGLLEATSSIRVSGAISRDFIDPIGI